MDRLFERAFNRVHAQVNSVQSGPPQGTSKPAAGNQDEPPEEPEVKSAIQSILLHWKNKEYFK